MLGNVFSLSICWSSFLWKCTELWRHWRGASSFFPFLKHPCRRIHSPWPLIFRTKTTQSRSVDYPSVPVTLSGPMKGTCGTDGGAVARWKVKFSFKRSSGAFDCPKPTFPSYFWSFSSKSGVEVSGSSVQGHTPGSDLICVEVSFEKGGQFLFCLFNHCLRM